MASPSDVMSAEALWDALTGFHERPGRYAVARREPQLLFDCLLDVLQLAADRLTSGSAGAPPPEVARRAARFFVRTVMLRPGASHYDLLGFTPQGDLAALREHYRLLIRLTHPDFARESEPWPSDAAARVNRAYDVLSSSVKRAEYDAQRPAQEGSMPAATVRAAPPRRKSPAKSGRRRWHLGVYASCALVLGALGALSMLWSSSEDDSLGVASVAVSPLLKLTEVVEASEGVTEGSKAPYKAVPGVISRSPSVVAAFSSDPKGSLLSRTVRLTSDERSKVALASPERSIASPREPVQAITVPPEQRERPPMGERISAPVASSGEAIAAQRANEDRPVGALERPTQSADIRTYQPVLADLLHMLESGQSERVHTWVARATQQDSSAQRFASAYRKLLDDAVVTGLGPVRFDLAQVQDRQVVRGSVQIRMLDRDQQVTVKDFRIRANFVSHVNGPQLASLDAE